MWHLLALLTAGYHYGCSNHGSDSTVSSLEWALQHVDEEAGSAFAALAYSENAIQYLEARLFAGYVISSLAAIKSGNLDLAVEEYQRAASLAKMTVKGQCKPPSVEPLKVREMLALLEHRLTEAGVLLN